MKVTIVGAGGWGTALACLLSKHDHQVTLWGHNPTHLDELRSGQNRRYLPGIPLPDGLALESRLDIAVRNADCLVLAVPSRNLREVVESAPAFSGIIISVTKGIEYETGFTMSELLRRRFQHEKIAALSGPTLALEVARGTPAAIVAASRDLSVAKAVQQLFHRPAFRVYTSTDLLGVELGGALKNVIAIAAGVSDGLGFGDNSKAALVTRAIVEIRRLGVACGAQTDTFAGLSGLGDLTVTCFSKLSRNRGLGERLGRGEKLAAIMESTPTVAEGYPTARSAYQLAKKLSVSTPIVDEVFAMLYEGKDVREALHDLTTRDSKAEN